MITLQEAKELAEGYKVVPISKEIMADIKTPIEVLRILKGVSKHCYMLESVENQEKWGRYTFLGYEPTMEITCMNGRMTIRNGKESTKMVSHPGEWMKEILQEYRSPKVACSMHTVCCARLILPHICFILAVMTWRWQGLRRKHLSNWKMERFIPFHWQEQGQEEQPSPRMNVWKRNFLPMKRNCQSTIC